MKKEELVKSILGEEAQIVRPILGGMMNDSYLIKYKDKEYILYIATAQANEMVNRKEELNHLMMVYELGITSRNIYFDVTSGIKINEFISGNSINNINEFDFNKVADLLRKLHTSGLKSNLDYLPFERFAGFEKEALEFTSLDETYQRLKNEVFSKKDHLASRPMALCHNDFQRSNIVRSNDDKYYVIDFEFMANNDPIYDIACFGNNDVKEGYALLKAYYKDQLDQEKEDRYYLWRMFVSLQWYVVALIKHYRGEGATHQMDFMMVANHFMNNALEAEKGLKR